jgi:pyruvate,water dikinase
MFTKNPQGRADQRVIEASWGLGETVVAGSVVPDRYYLARGGALLARELGDKDVAVVLANDDGTVEQAVPSARRASYCLDEKQLAALEELAAACDEAYGAPSDVEWAFAGGRLYLLQRRPVTR